MFSAVSHKDDSQKAKDKQIRKSQKKQQAPTQEEIQKKFDEQSFKHQLAEEWAGVKRKTLFVPTEITKSVTSGEFPHMVTIEVVNAVGGTSDLTCVCTCCMYFTHPLVIAVLCYVVGNVCTFFSSTGVFVIRPTRAMVRVCSPLSPARLALVCVCLVTLMK